MGYAPLAGPVSSSVQKMRADPLSRTCTVSSMFQGSSVTASINTGKTPLKELSVWADHNSPPPICSWTPSFRLRPHQLHQQECCQNHQDSIHITKSHDQFSGRTQLLLSSSSDMAEHALFLRHLPPSACSPLPLLVSFASPPDCSSPPFSDSPSSLWSPKVELPWGSGCGPLPFSVYMVSSCSPQAADSQIYIPTQTFPKIPVSSIHYLGSIQKEEETNTEDRLQRY